VYPDRIQVERLVESRYGAASWLNRR
jgi:hypothetical protein